MSSHRLIVQDWQKRDSLKETALCKFLRMNLPFVMYLQSSPKQGVRKRSEYYTETHTYIIH